MKMMVCYNSSEPARRALELARHHARMMNGRILAVSSILLDDRFQAKEKQEFENELRLFQASCEEEGIPFEIFLSGSGIEPATDLVNFSLKHKVDHIYVGLQKRSKVGKFLMGSTTQDLLINADCPVVVVK